jgi:hypothetical protein
LAGAREDWAQPEPIEQAECRRCRRGDHGQTGRLLDRLDGDERRRRDAGGAHEHVETPVQVTKVRQVEPADRLVVGDFQADAVVRARRPCASRSRSRGSSSSATSRIATASGKPALAGLVADAR